MTGVAAFAQAPDGQVLDGQVLAALLDELDAGVALASARGLTVYSNRKAVQWGAACGLRLGAHEMLGVACAAETRRLRQLVHAACTGGPVGSVRLTARGGSGGLAARVSALSTGPFPAAGPFLALVMLRRLGGDTPVDTGRLMAMFGLTRAEAAILPALVAGETTGAVARGLGVSTNTVRTHVRAVLAKTQAANLRALAMLVSTAMVG